MFVILGCRRVGPGNVSDFDFFPNSANSVRVVHAMQSAFPWVVMPPTHPHERLDYAIANTLTPFISMQNHYSLVYREEEREMFPTLKVCLPRTSIDQ